MKKTNIDSPFYRTMGKIGDLLFANLLWLVCCLPIVTAGASTLGLFTVVNKMAAKEDYTVHTDFFKAFKRDFKQSTALWLVLLLAGFAALTGLRPEDLRELDMEDYERLQDQLLTFRGQKRPGRDTGERAADADGEPVPADPVAPAGRAGADA